MIKAIKGAILVWPLLGCVSNSETSNLYDYCPLENPFCSESRVQCHIFGDEIKCFDTAKDACNYAGCGFQNCSYIELLPSKIECS